jgi:hypothetical protein
VLCVSNKFGILYICRHIQQQTLNKKGNESRAYLDPQITMRTNIYLARKDVVAYFFRAMSRYKDKEMLVVPFNTGNHWVTLSISTKYE